MHLNQARSCVAHREVVDIEMVVAAEGDVADRIFLPTARIRYCGLLEGVRALASRILLRGPHRIAATHKRQQREIHFAGVAADWTHCVALLSANIAYLASV